MHRQNQIQHYGRLGYVRSIARPAGSVAPLPFDHPLYDGYRVTKSGCFTYRLVRSWRLSIAWCRMSQGRKRQSCNLPQKCFSRRIAFSSEAKLSQEIPVDLYRQANSSWSNQMSACLAPILTGIFSPRGSPIPICIQSCSSFSSSPQCSCSCAYWGHSPAMIATP